MRLQPRSIYTINVESPGQYYLYFSDRTPADNVAPDYYGDGGIDNITKGTVVTVPVTGGAQTLTAGTVRRARPSQAPSGTPTPAAETASHVMRN